MKLSTTPATAAGTISFTTGRSAGRDRKRSATAETVRRNVRRLLAVTGRTQQQMSQRFGRDDSWANHKLAGRTVFHLWELDELADWFGVTVVDLVTSDRPAGVGLAGRAASGSVPGGS